MQHLLDNSSSVLNIKDFISNYNKPTIHNLLDKISYTVNTVNSEPNNVIEVFNKNNILQTIMSNLDIIKHYKHSHKKTMDLTELVPVRIKCNLLDNEVFILNEHKVSSIDLEDYNNIISKENTIVEKIDMIDNNDIYKDISNCLNDKCYNVYTRLQYLHNLGIEVNDIKNINLDDDIIFIYIEVPTVMLDEVIDNVIDKDQYYVNTMVRRASWLNPTFINNIFTKPMNEIINNNVRKFIWEIRKDYEKIGLHTIINNDMIQSIKKLMNVIWNDDNISELIEDFPELKLLDNNIDIELSKILFIGSRRRIKINSNSTDELTNLILEKVKEEI